MRKIFVALCIGVVSLAFSTPLPMEEDGWAILAKVKFTEKLIKPQDEYYLVPFFDSKIRAYSGKAFMLKGHYLPMDLDDKHTIILSRVPFSMCFFCGGAGPESVAEVHFVNKPPRLKPDQVITVKGILRLNDSDINHMNFILEDAAILDNP